MTSEDEVMRHAVVRVGDSPIMISSAEAEYGGVGAALHLYVEDVDRMYESAMAAGGTSLGEPEDRFHGDRTAGVKDAWGHQWWISTHIEDVDPAEMRRREKEFREGR